MKYEKNRENGCLIYTILFKNKDPGYMSEVKEKPEDILQKIAELGGTEKYYLSKDTTELLNVFKSINQAIKTSFGSILN